MFWVVFGILLFSYIGGILLHKGSYSLRTLRTIEDSPTVRIATGALGTNVEISGRAFSPPGQVLIAPDGSPAVLYELKIERHRKQKRWDRVETVVSTDPFWVDDGSGALAMVWPAKCDLRLSGRKCEWEYSSHQFDSLPPDFAKALRRHSGDFVSFKFRTQSRALSSKYRFTQRLLLPGYKAYVMGFADKPEGASTIPKPYDSLPADSAERFGKMIRRDKWLKLRFDTDGDGELSDAEVAAGTVAMGREMFGLRGGAGQEEGSIEGGESSADVRMTIRKKEGALLLISDHSETALVDSLRSRLNNSIFMGVYSVVVLLWYALAHADVVLSPDEIMDGLMQALLGR